MNAISTPRGSIVKTENGTATLTWNSDFQPKWDGRYDTAQRFLDSEILRLDSAYIPLQSSMLEKSGILGTEVGSGCVQYIAPYAKKQYYDTADSRSYDPLRGGHWFERMKAEHGQVLIEETKRRAAGGNK